MTETKSYAPGRFSWVELETNDVAAAKRFYGPLLGWSWDEVRAGPAEAYTMAKTPKGQVGGISSLKPGQKQMGVPPHWSVYVAVENADLAGKKAAELGGEVVVPAFDVMDAGRMAILRDPQGAFFRVWQAKKHLGAGVTNEPGAVDWLELVTPDPVQAASFYGKLFGWITKVMDMGTIKYTMCSLGEAPIAGMMTTDPRMKVPPSWVVYFNVKDVDGTVRNAKESQGSVLVPPAEVPNMVRFALLTDPQGAAFGIAKALHEALSSVTMPR